MGEFFLVIEMWKLVCMFDFMGWSILDSLFLLCFRILGKDMLFGGLKFVDFRVESICGDEVECFSVCCWRIGGMLGDLGIFKVVFSKFELFVFKFN